MGRRSMPLWIAIALLGLLLGCGTSVKVDNDPPQGSNTDTGTSATPDDADADSANTDPGDASESGEAGEAAGSTPHFGQSVTWDEGLTVTISKPRKYEPSDTAAGAEGPGTALRFTITVVNKTGGPYESDGEYITVQSADAEAEQIFDSEKGLEGSPSTKLLDGRQAKYDVAFMVVQPDDLVMEFQPGDWGMDSVVFTLG